MSLILEALRRSERERSSRAGEAAAIAVPTGYGAPGARRRLPGPAVAGALAGLLLALLGLGWWLLGPGPDRPPAASAPAAPSLLQGTPPRVAADDRTRIRPAEEPSPVSQAPAPAVPEWPTPAAAPLLAPASPAQEPEVVDLSAQLEPAPEPAARAPEPPAAAPRPAGPSDLAAQLSGRARPTPAPEPPSAKVPALAELPEAFQESVPALDVQVHFYSRDPERRFVLVNGRRYRPGEELMRGLALVEIQRSGSVLEWRGQRFLMPAGGGP